MSQPNSTTAITGRSDERRTVKDVVSEYVRSARWFAVTIVVVAILGATGYGIDTLAGPTSESNMIVHTVAGLLGTLAIMLAIFAVIVFAASVVGVVLALR